MSELYHKIRCKNFFKNSKSKQFFENFFDSLKNVLWVPSKFQLTCRWLVFSHYDGNVSPDHHKKWFVSLLWPQAKYGSKWLPRCRCSKLIETYRSSYTGRRRAHPRYFRFRRRPPPGLLPAVKVNHFKKLIFLISNCTNISSNSNFLPILFRMTLSLWLFKQTIWRKTLKLRVLS